MSFTQLSKPNQIALKASFLLGKAISWPITILLTILMNIVLWFIIATMYTYYKVKDKIEPIDKIT